MGRLWVGVRVVVVLGPGLRSRQDLRYCENRARIKCGFRGAICGEVPMCKVPGKVWGRTVLFAVAELLVFAVKVCDKICSDFRRLGRRRAKTVNALSVYTPCFKKKHPLILLAIS